MFVTFFVGVLNLKNGEVRFANAGHNPPVIIRSGGEVEMLELKKSIPIGLFDNMQFSESSVRLRKGDKFFMYTDGVTEAEDCSMNLYSTERLLKVLKENKQELPEALIKSVGKDLNLHVCSNPQSDDITMMAIIYYG